MRLPPHLLPATLSRRLNRFAVEVELGGKMVAAHLANSGCLEGLMVPGAAALLAPCDSPRRKTAYDLLLVRLGERWVSADARLPNALVREALAQGRIEALRGYRVSRAEARYGNSRVDSLLAGPRGPCLLEVKSVTLVVNSIALFPDAPTARGVRHLQALLKARCDGLEAAVLFVVQRADVVAFATNAEADTTFCSLLHCAGSSGVQVLAYRCRVSPYAISITAPLPVRL